MNTPDPWHARAEELADWALDRVFVWTDRFGGYYRKDGEKCLVTRPTKASPEAFSRAVLLKHFRAGQTDDVIGAHPLRPGRDGTGRWVNNDIDLHGPEDDHERNAHKAIHQLFADHCCAEYRVQTSGRGRVVEEWKTRPDRQDNHWLDCLTGCAMAASVLGVNCSSSVAAGEPPEDRKPRARIRMSEVYARKYWGGVRG